ncbi:hypothetical protein GCM10014713_52170 [Streptomyces purpureus]|uniref:Uncharacterized protein n=1 Tax=Streptomyces purpureus TaxID=1951 RepID=A0A918LUJ9_9ACTN|nr:hypothetical protein GCM10014713_52170 [Streptomyces purpureus]
MGMALLIVGGAGVLRELTDGWFSIFGFTRFLTDHIGFLQGRELFAHIVLAVLGFAMLMIADRSSKA